MYEQTRWTGEADVLVVGFGGAGAVAAIAAHDAGAKVIILEKLPSDTPTRTRHTPNTRMSGGGWLDPPDAGTTALYLEGMARIANETVDEERKGIISVFSRYLVDNTRWMRSIGVDIGGMESISPTIRTMFKQGAREVVRPDFPDLPGADCCRISHARINGKYRHGAAFFKSLSEAVQKRGIEVMWETRAAHLITRDGDVSGVEATQGDTKVGIRANRAVVLTCGGFEFNQQMKENYLRVNPVLFYGNPANTGDGINMALEVGAALWHMNHASWRVTMKFPDSPTFCTQNHETASIFIDRRGHRFSNERFRLHAFGYELVNYDCYAMCYPRVPCYWIFDEKRRAIGPVASFHGPCNPPGGIMGDIHYLWSADNQAEIDRGWIMKADTIEGLANKILADPDTGNLMSATSLLVTVKRYNEYCRKGKDLDFHKQREWLQPLEDPPYYAIKLWPGGPNTSGGPKRNSKGQVLRTDNSPIPRLYAAGELGSVWGMLSQSGGHLGECIAFGRIAGTNAAAEKAWGQDYTSLSS